MKHRFAVLEEGSRPRIFKVPVSQSARLVNEFPDRKVEIFETLPDAKAAALALIERIRANTRPRAAMFSIKPTNEDDELRKLVSELSEDRVETYFF